jgi:hypothetical protein
MHDAGVIAKFGLVVLAESLGYDSARRAMAAISLRSSVADLSGGRFIRGLGSSHKVQVEPEHGVTYGKPHPSDCGDRARFDP